VIGSVAGFAGNRGWCIGNDGHLLLLSRSAVRVMIAARVVALVQWYAGSRRAVILSDNHHELASSRRADRDAGDTD
jgi:hypothetical protein